MTAVFQPTMDMMLARKQALEENLRLINSPENISEAEWDNRIRDFKNWSFRPC